MHFNVFNLLTNLNMYTYQKYFLPFKQRTKTGYFIGIYDLKIVSVNISIDNYKLLFDYF